MLEAVIVILIIAAMCAALFFLFSFPDKRNAKKLVVHKAATTCRVCGSDEYAFAERGLFPLFLVGLLFWPLLLVWILMLFRQSYPHCHGCGARRG